MTRWAQRWPLTTFFGLAFALTWALLPLARTSVVVSLLALLGPAAAALITAGLGGREPQRDLRMRVALWRVPISWYVVALLLPFPISALRSVVEYLSGATGPIQLQPISALGLIVFGLVAGEEVGWRGFALPRLLSRFGPWSASALLGLLWALWHLPLFYMPGMPQYGTPFPSYVPYLAALSVILTVLALETKGSVIIATLFHGAVNTFGIVNAGATAPQRGWGNALTYGAVALLIGVFAWPRRRARYNSFCS
jgi:uncharacterized protein